MVTENMIYRVQVEVKGCVDCYAEADSREEAIFRVMDGITLDDVELFCEKCYPVEAYARKTKGES